MYEKSKKIVRDEGNKGRAKVGKNGENSER
jgi:hypothetical protein